MGQCIGKGSDDPFNDIHPHIFSVLNIDENGRYAHSIPLQYTIMYFALKQQPKWYFILVNFYSRKVEGRIEVTETDLILNQRGHDRIRWPLRSLRRYGFEAGVFR